MTIQCEQCGHGMEADRALEADEMALCGECFHSLEDAQESLFDDPTEADDE